MPEEGPGKSRVIRHETFATELLGGRGVLRDAEERFEAGCLFGRKT
jgi:hypothetical protein